MLRKVLQWLEGACAGGVVFEVVRVNIDLLEELDGDAVVATLAEVHTILYTSWHVIRNALSGHFKNTHLEVSTAQVQSDNHVARVFLQAIVVRLDVRIEDRLVVDFRLLHTLDHRLRAEVSQERIIDLDVPAAGSVELLELLLVRNGDIGKVLVVVLVHVLVVRVLAVAEVVPFGRAHGDLEPAVLLRRRDGLQSLELADVEGSCAGKLAFADVGGCVFEAELLERQHVGDVVHEHVQRD